MDFTSLLNHLTPSQRMVQSWFATSGVRMSFVLAFKSRLSLLGMISIFKNRKRLVGVVSDEETALHYIKLCKPGMLFCGDELEEGDGYSLVARAKDLVPDLLVMMILNAPSPDVERAIALKAQVICLDGDIFTVERIAAFGLLAAIKGKYYVSPLAQKSLNRDLTAAESNATAMLTPTEKKVMEFMLKGLNDREIANSLCLSIHTVRDYNKSIRYKFGVKSKLQLIAVMVRNSFGLSE